MKVKKKEHFIHYIVLRVYTASLYYLAVITASGNCGNSSSKQGFR